MAHTGGNWYVKHWNKQESVVCSNVDGKEVHITKACMQDDAVLLANAPRMLNLIKKVLRVNFDPNLTNSNYEDDLFDLLNDVQGRVDLSDVVIEVQS